MFVFNDVEFLFVFGLIIFPQRDHHVGLVGLLSVNGTTAALDLIEFLSVNKGKITLNLSGIINE